MLPSSAELSYFLEVTNTLNVSLAAKNLNISQPTLSRAIQNLENTVGTELLIRHKKGVALTPAGKKVLFKVKNLLDDWNTTKLEALASHQHVEGHIKIGCHPTVGLFIHPYITDLLLDYPKLDIELNHSTSAIITQQVIDVLLDIGIVTNPMQYPDLVIHKLSEYSTTLWTSSDKQKTQDIYSGEAILICDPNTHYAKTIIKQCKSMGITFKRIVKTNSLEVTANLAANGCGIAALPSCITKTLFDQQLQRIPDMPTITDELCLIYRNEYRNVSVVKTVVDKFKTKP